MAINLIKAARDLFPLPFTLPDEASGGVPPKEDTHGGSTSHGPVFAPMLAANWAQVGRIIAPEEDLLVSPKLDGIRCIVGISKLTERLEFISRRGNAFECADHIAAHLAPLFDEDPLLVLDGELYNHLYARDFDTIVGSVKVSRSNATPEHLQAQRLLQLHIFDVPRCSDYQQGKHTGEVVPFALRYAKCVEVAEKLRATADSPLRLVEHQAATTEKIDKIMTKALADKYEGIMIRTARGGYAFGRRSNELMKYKKMQDAEFEIVGTVEGEGYLKGSLGAFVCQTPEGKTFMAAPAVDRTTKDKLWANRVALTGQSLTVQFQNLTQNGVPRFPIGKYVRGNPDDWV